MADSLNSAIDKFYEMGKMTNAKQRDARKLQMERIQQPLQTVLRHVIAGEPIYKEDWNVVSRAYRASGEFSDADFDLHLLLNMPENCRLNYNDQTLPFVELQSIVVQSDWMKVTTEFAGRLFLSPLMIFQQLHEKMLIAAGIWNKGTDTSSVAKVIVEPLTTKASIRLLIEMKSENDSSSTTLIEITPVLYTAGMASTEGIKKKIATAANFNWPTDEQKRRNLAEYMVLVPRQLTNNWLISMQLAQKMLVQSLNDNDATCRLKLYRVLKWLNKRYWCQQATGESMKIGLSTIQNVFFCELSRRHKDGDWTSDKRGQRLRNLINEVRLRLAMVDFRAYMVPGVGHNHNPLAVFKTGAFLQPKLGAIVRRVERTVKDPQLVLGEILKQAI